MIKETIGARLLCGNCGMDITDDIFHLYAGCKPKALPKRPTAQPKATPKGTPMQRANVTVQGGVNKRKVRICKKCAGQNNVELYVPFGMICKDCLESSPKRPEETSSETRKVCANLLAARTNTSLGGAEICINMEDEEEGCGTSYMSISLIRNLSKAFKEQQSAERDET
jgi:hypothetical protein